MTPLVHIFENTDKWEFKLTYKNFSRFLFNYSSDLGVMGQTITLSQDEMKNIIYSQKNNTEHYVYNLNQVKHCIEQIIDNDNNKNNCINISTTSENNFLVCCYDALSCSHTGGYDNPIALDWGYSTGESLGGMTAQAYIEDDIYHMNLKYYLIDTYEFPYHWSEEDHEDSLTRFVHGLHEAGKAKEFKIIGCYEESFEWKKGEFLYKDSYNPNIKIYKENYYSSPID